jgi:hypothetical protein
MSTPDFPGHRPDGPSERTETRPRPFTREELEGPLSCYPPLMTVKQAASLLQVSQSCIHHRVGRGEFRNAVVRGRKPLLFFRDRLVKDYFSGR